MPHSNPPSQLATEPALPRRRCAGLALATVLALSACSTSKLADPPTSATSRTKGAASLSPSESSPAPGEWTLEDLKVGAKVPKEDLERLFPAWDKPIPPATLTEESEQGAKDAAVYFSEIVEYVAVTQDVTPINEIDSELCRNCDALRDSIKAGRTKQFFRTKPEFLPVSATLDPETDGLYDGKVQSHVDVFVRLDTSHGAVEEVGSSGTNEANMKESEISHYITFYDGRWQPLGLNLAD